MKRNCEACKKEFTVRYASQIYCSPRCRNNPEKVKRILKFANKPSKGPFLKECNYCKRAFETNLWKKAFCCNFCQENAQARQYIEDWANRVPEDPKAISKRNRRNNAGLNWEVYEMKDVVSKRLKVMRG
jgi:hypothetical protein